MAKFAGSQALAIGAEIRRHRVSLDWTLETLAVATDISRSTLSRIETGARRPTVDEVASILTALGITGSDKERLIRLAADWSYTWVGTGAGVSQQLSAISAYESEAKSISELQISVFPGLLQTSEYSRMLISTSPIGSAERERAVFTRVGRQSVLTRPGLMTYQAFIDEAAFKRKVGNSKTMIAQFHHMLDVGSKPGKLVRVVPFYAGAYWGCEGAFTLYNLSDNHRIVYQENQGSGVFIEDKSTDVYKNVLDSLSDVALSAKESELLISTYLEQYENEV